MRHAPLIEVRRQYVVPLGQSSYDLREVSLAPKGEWAETAMPIVHLYEWHTVLEIQDSLVLDVGLPAVHEEPVVSVVLAHGTFEI